MANKIKQWVHKFQSQDRAAVTLITALLLAILIGFLGLATDTSYAFYVRTKMQAAADAAALGGASNMLNGGSKEDAAGVAQSLATLNGFKDGESFTSVTTSIPPGPNPDGSSPSYSDNSSYIRVQIAQSVRLFFAPLIGFANTWTVQANAVAGIKNTQDCFIAYKKIKNDGSSTSTLINCSILFGSSGLDAKGASGGFNITNGDYFGYANGLLDCNSNNCIRDQTPISKATSKSGAMPSSPTVSLPTGLTIQTGCTGNICQPGIYNTDPGLNNGNYVFKPGSYVFNAGLTMNQNTKITGDNVLLYFNSNQNITFRGDILLTAPTPAGCNPGSGVVMYSPNPLRITLSTNSPTPVKITGVVAIPFGDFVTSAESMLTLSGSVVANTITFNGGISSSASSNPCNNFVSQNKVSLVQ